MFCFLRSNRRQGGHFLIMELKKLDVIGQLELHRVEDVSKYPDPELTALLKGIFGLSDVPGTIKKLRAKEIYLLADGVAKKPLGNLILPVKAVAPAPSFGRGGAIQGKADAKPGITVPMSVYRKGQDLASAYPPPRLVPEVEAALEEPEKPKKFTRSKSERRKTLKRDADDPKSGLKPDQRQFIKDTDGNNVPKDCEVSHETPLYSAKAIEEKRELDVADNMKTMDKSKHRDRHRFCGDTYHKYPR